MKIDTKCLKSVKYILVKKRPKLGPSVSGTKWDRIKQIFLQKEWVNRILLKYKTGTHSDRKSPKQGSSLRNLPTIPKYGSTTPGLKHTDMLFYLIYQAFNGNTAYVIYNTNACNVVYPRAKIGLGQIGKLLDSIFPPRYSYS